MIGLSRHSREADLYHKLMGNPDARKGWVVSTTSRSFYLRATPGSHCTGGWVELEAGLTGMETFAPKGIRPPNRLARDKSLYRLHEIL
jgi:hypothetical protein